MVTDSACVKTYGDWRGCGPLARQPRCVVVSLFVRETVLNHRNISNISLLCAQGKVTEVDGTQYAIKTMNKGFMDFSQAMVSGQGIGGGFGGWSVSRRRRCRRKLALCGERSLCLHSERSPLWHVYGNSLGSYYCLASSLLSNRVEQTCTL